MKKRALIGPAIILLIWSILYLSRAMGPLFLPSPLEVLKALLHSVFRGHIMSDVISTLYRMTVGFCLGAIVGIPVGLLMGYSRKIYDALEFLVDFVRSIPALALFPLFLLVLGIGDKAKIGIVTFACALVVLMNTMYGVQNAKKTRIMVAKTIGASQFHIFTKVVLWDALPQIATGLRISVSMALLVVVVTEMFLGTERGLGQRIYNAHLIYRIPEMYASIILTGLLGYSINRIYVRIERRVVHWAGK